MKYTLQRLQADVMARLGEIARAQAPDSGGSALSDVPRPEDTVCVKCASLLAEVGARLIREAPTETLACGASMQGVQAAMRKMPCGLFGAEVVLPRGFLRLASVRMSGWRGSVHSAATPDDSGWMRQWSSHPVIAGCPERPRAYLDSGGEGVLLRLMGCVSADEEVESLLAWCVPEVDEEGKFEFPEVLYGNLVGEISGKL